jgi:hypothetical protein
MLSATLIELLPALPLIVGLWAGLWLLAIQSYEVLSMPPEYPRLFETAS